MLPCGPLVKIVRDKGLFVSSICVLLPPVSRCLPAGSEQRALAASAFMEMCRWSCASVWHWDVSRGGTLPRVAALTVSRTPTDEPKCIPGGQDRTWVHRIVHWTPPLSLRYNPNMLTNNANVVTRNYREATGMFFLIIIISSIYFALFIYFYHKMSFN